MWYRSIMLIFFAASLAIQCVAQEVLVKTKQKKTLAEMKIADSFAAFDLAAFNEDTFCVSYDQGDTTFIQMFVGGKMTNTFRFPHSLKKIGFNSNGSLVMVSDKNILTILDTKSRKVLQNEKMKPEDYWQAMNPDVFKSGVPLTANYFHPSYRAIETGFDYGYQFYFGIESPDVIYQILDHYILIYDKEMSLRDQSIYAKHISSLTSNVVFIDPGRRFLLLFSHVLKSLMYYNFKTHKTTPMPISAKGLLLDIIHPPLDDDLWVLTYDNDKVYVSTYAIVPNK